MNTKKKSRRCQVLVWIQTLDLVISRFIHSLECKEEESEPRSQASQEVTFEGSHQRVPVI
jgi:hypothetical protein